MPIANGQQQIAQQHLHNETLILDDDFVFLISTNIMADITFTIPLPVLSAGESFKYRYRVVGGAYGGYTSVMTQTITITGLTQGEYEVEIIFVKADLTECPAVVKQFTVLAPFTCYTFDAEIIQSGLQYVLRITYPLPSPLVHPACGWRVSWAQIGGSGSTTYTTLPLSGEINIVLPGNKNTSLSIIADDCKGNLQFCFEEDVPKIPSPTCQALQITWVDMVYSQPVPNTLGTFAVRLQVINSNPLSPTYTIHLQETSIVPAGYIPDQQTYSQIGGGGGGAPWFYGNQFIFPKGIYQQIPNPNPDLPPEYVQNCISYQGNIVDVCGNSIPFSVSRLWTPNPAGSVILGSLSTVPC